jgi:hypothetical protein
MFLLQTAINDLFLVNFPLVVQLSLFDCFVYNLWSNDNMNVLFFFFVFSSFCINFFQLCSAV